MQTMKNFPLLVLAGLLLLILASNCNNKKTDPNAFECINSSFMATLPIQFKPTYIEEDNKGNIIILGSFDAVIKIVKLNAQGELLWQKEYLQIIGEEQGLVYIDENSFLIKTSTSQYEYELSNHLYENIWIKNSNMLDASNNYIPTYELYSGQPELQLPNSNKTYLSKINADGAVLWTKEFKGDACNGNSFFRLDHNNFLLLTSEFYGPYYEIVDYNGHVDTITHPNDRNKRIVYKIDNDGGIRWSTEVDNIFNVHWDPAGGYDLGFQHSITQNGDRVIINTLNNTYELSKDGNLLQSYQPQYNNQGNWTYYMEKASETENYFFGELHTNDSFIEERYLLKYDMDSKQTVWEKKPVQFPMQISSYPNKSLFTAIYGTNFYSIEKFNPDGELLWKKEIPKSYWSEINIKASCNSGVIVAIYDSSTEKLKIIKANENGEY